MRCITIHSRPTNGIWIFPSDDDNYSVALPGLGNIAYISRKSVSTMLAVGQCVFGVIEDQLLQDNIYSCYPSGTEAMFILACDCHHDADGVLWLTPELHPDNELLVLTREHWRSPRRNSHVIGDVSTLANINDGNIFYSLLDVNRESGILTVSDVVNSETGKMEQRLTRSLYRRFDGNLIIEPLPAL